MSTRIQSASDRQAITDRANTWIQSDEYLDEQKEKEEETRKENIRIYSDGLYNQILGWCNITDINNKSALENSLKLQVNSEFLDQDMLNELETELTQKGYTITKEDNFITISQ